MLRERKRLVKQRTSLTNSMKGLLRLHGIAGVNPCSKDFSSRLGALKTGYGETLGEAARDELGRLRADGHLRQIHGAAPFADSLRIWRYRKRAGSSETGSIPGPGT